jgi:hypothetical protein
VVVDPTPASNKRPGYHPSPADDVPADLRDSIRDGIRLWAESRGRAEPDTAALARSAQLARARAVKSEHLVVAVHEIWYQLFPSRPRQFDTTDLAHVIDVALSAYYRVD